jgi:hypothetical protein
MKCGNRRNPRQACIYVLAHALTITQQVFHRILDLKHGLGFYPGFFVLKKKKNPHRLIDVGPQTNNSKLVIEGKIKRM